MKQILQTPNQLSKWQREREQLLHRACRGVETRIFHGEKPRRAFRRVAAYFGRRTFKCDSKRRLMLSEKTLRRHFKNWKCGGELPGVFHLRYRARRSVFTAPILVRFVNFISERPHTTMKAAWETFCARGGNFGCGRRAGKPLKISYGQLQHNFSAALFYQIRQEHRAIEVATANLGALQTRAIADIRQRFPEHLPRKRVKRESDFQI